MSFTDRLVIWLHVAFVIFAIGPVSIAILSTPRYIRLRNVAVLRYLLRMTRIFGAASLGVLAFGIVAAQELKKLSSAWVSTAMTLFVVSLVLLVLIMRDQRKAIAALAAAERLGDGTGRSEEAETATTADGTPTGGGQPATTVVGELKTAAIERGRIASMSGVVGLIWLAVIVLMVWNGG
jgi:choline-glycine betaine transporter